LRHIDTFHPSPLKKEMFQVADLRLVKMRVQGNRSRRQFGRLV
jgi:hypothetical protein